MRALGDADLDNRLPCALDNATEHVRRDREIPHAKLGGSRSFGGGREKSDVGRD